MTNSARAGERILGSLESAGGKGIVRMEDRFDTDVDDVWSASPTPCVWPTGTARSRAISASAASTTHAFRQRVGRCRTRGSVRAPAAAAGANQGRGRAGRDDIEVTLTADGDQTIVVWEEQGVPLDMLSAYGAGVQLHVEDLADHLARRDAARTSRRDGPIPTLPIKASAANLS